MQALFSSSLDILGDSILIRSEWDPWTFLFSARHPVLVADGPSLAMRPLMALMEFGFSGRSFYCILFRVS